MTRKNNALHPSVVAERLGVSIDSVYEQIRRGALPAEKDGKRWAVVLDPTTGGPEQAGQVESDRELPVSHESDRSASGEPYHVVSLRSLAAQVAEQRKQIDQIRTHLESLQSNTQVVPEPAIPSVAAPVRTTGSGTNDPGGDDFLWRRARQVALGSIVALVLGGSAIQTSSAQRSDDLTIAFIFMCGAVTGAIAVWLALDKRRQTPAGDDRRAAKGLTQTAESEAPLLVPTSRQTQDGNW